MKIVSVEVDGQIYIVGGADLDFKTFDAVEEFSTFLNGIVNTFKESKDSTFDALPVVSILLSGSPRIHDFSNPDAITDVVEEETEITVLAAKDTEVPFMSLIACSGPDAKKWRDSGVDINSPEKTSVTNYENPRVRGMKITPYVHLPTGSIH